MMSIIKYIIGAVVVHRILTDPEGAQHGIISFIAEAQALIIQAAPVALAAVQAVNN